MRITEIKSCYIGPEISPEQFIPEHFFLYIAKGTIHGYDGNTTQTLKSGEYAIVRKNRLARYNKEKENNEFEKVVVIFDELFLKKFQEQYKTKVGIFDPAQTFIKAKPSDSVSLFLQSLLPYYMGNGKIDARFADSKREELLLILLQEQPELAGVFFDYGMPGKINLEEFMNRNYKFKVSLQRFAYLTGRSLSGFKRDFKTIFGEAPNRWLMQKRLKESYFLIDKKKMKPSEIFVELGFEDLSHFSYAFKKKFGLTFTELADSN